MAVGMATVFAFLSLLVGSMLLAGRIFQRWGHLVPDEESLPAAESPDEGAQVAVALAVAAREASKS